MNALDILESGKQETNAIQGFITGLFNEKPDQELEIAEAGCGRYWPIGLNDVRYKLTGIDLDEAALKLRQEKYNDLDKIMVADLRTVNMKSGSCDIVYNSYVLEHIPEAALVLDNFFEWLKPGGYLILRIPDRDSVYGFFTRISPLWVHLIYHKHIRKAKNAGKPGYGPYPTYYDSVVSRSGIRKYCEENDIQIMYEAGHPFYLNGDGFIQSMTKFFVKFVSACSFGTLAWRHNNLTFILKK